MPDEPKITLPEAFITNTGVATLDVLMLSTWKVGLKTFRESTVSNHPFAALLYICTEFVALTYAL